MVAAGATVAAGTATAAEIQQSTKNCSGKVATVVDAALAVSILLAS